MRRFILLIAAASLTACASAPNPHKTIAALDVTAPKYETLECTKARHDAEAYKSEFGKRIMMGAAWGLVPIYGNYRAYKIDEAKDQERARLNAAVAEACGLGPRKLPITSPPS